jgi:hypothetical protein
MTETQSLNGYYGPLSTNVTLNQLKSCSESQIDVSQFDLDIKTSLQSDPNTVTVNEKQSVGPFNYTSVNYHGCDCELEKARNLQLQQPMVNFKGGQGWMGENGCLIDKDSQLRFDTLTNLRYIHQLKTLKNQGYFGKGVYDVDSETIVREGDQTSVDKPCNVFAGSSTLPYSITPMIPHLSDNVQDTKNLIQEDSNKAWPRGGLPTRQIMRNNDYTKRCNQK